MQKSPMKIKALVPWFGSKRMLAPRIVQMLGKHSVYWEPFCGSMAVLLVKPTCQNESVNDLHRDLYNLACVIQDRDLCLQLYKRLHHLLMHEDKLAEAREKAKLTFEPGLERAYWYFLYSWIGRNGNAGITDHNQHFCRRFTSRGGSPSVRLNSVIQSIPAWRRRLKRVCILNTDAFEILERIEDEPGLAMYVDPPYISIRDKYKHHFDTEDHERLADLLNRRFKKGRIVLSYYGHPKLTELYPDWDREEILVTKALANAVPGKRRAKAKEVLLCNQKIEGKGLFNG